MAVQLDALQILGLLTLVMIIPTYQGIRNWRENGLRRQAAMANGWRFTDRGWRSLFRSTYSMAGTAPNGAVWEFGRVQKGRQYYFVWSSRNVHLPYGTLVILPRGVAVLPAHTKRLSLRSMAVGSDEWRVAYKLLATHDLLGQRYFSREIELALLEWPRWPEPGAMEEIVWRRDGLFIRVRHKNDWMTINRIVVLGTTLVENAGQR
jgi:hypothetical protein